ncbi:HsdM family class I SAM-dependent methyltransferase [Maritalea sp.]|uniref:HsdM family class I SAM-dependent methyltransferase n=1 Tax=Maritalea sp. TaxID=2003361 RepID=UPI003EF8D812
MTTDTKKSWQKDFGIDHQSCPNFFSGTGDLGVSVPQSHVLRHAFELLELDGILCSENTPLIYFKRVNSIGGDEVIRLHRQFWNHGSAPVLVLISDDQVHVYSGMSRPAPSEESQNNPQSLVVTLDRVASELSNFLVSVESGEFFRRYSSAFNPDHRVDHDLLGNLKDARELLDQNTQRNIESGVLDALLCRLVFACYLFDRGVIGENYLNELGFEGLKHLRDVLKIQPVRDAKAALYKLFQKLGTDFNGDLFSDDLEVEARKITNKHVEILNDFFHGTKVRTGQLPFWPYDFKFIPIETISAIYEHFLKAEDQQKGAFYTPRFLAEIVLDAALEQQGSLIGKKFLDPACGSGIFLVGLFNRLAEEWKQANPKARNDRRARELMHLLQNSLFGVDINPTACRITAFSLYLAYLDQLAPRNIQELQKKGRALPRLVVQAIGGTRSPSGNLYCSDFFEDFSSIAELEKNFNNVDLVIGNPPWGSIAKKGTPADKWCREQNKPLPDNQIANAFIWKAGEHVSQSGHVCFILPHGVLLNHGPTAKKFQKAWMIQHTLHRVVNLADLRKFLFNEARHPAIVVNYQCVPPTTEEHRVKYWTPKADWITTQAEVIPVSPLDRDEISLKELIDDLDGLDGPQTWTRSFWGSQRDIRFLDRLYLYPRLRDHVRQSRDKDCSKPWFMAEGFQPLGENDDPDKAKTVELPTTKFLNASGATKRGVDLFLLAEDCEKLTSKVKRLRQKSNTNTKIFEAPHVLIPKGFNWVVYADFPVCFQHSIRGIHGPKKDRNFLIFLAAYLRSRLAKYIAFHTSHNRSMFHEEVHVTELMRLPFPFPGKTLDQNRGLEIINEVASIVDTASKRASENFLKHSPSIEMANAKIEPLVEEYFDIQPLEKVLIEDTLNVITTSIQPTQNRMPVPTVSHTTTEGQQAYKDRLCNMLNIWAKGADSAVRGAVDRSDALGIGIVVLEKVPKPQHKEPMILPDKNILQSLDRLRRAVPRKQLIIDPIRGIMVFDSNRLYIVKPLAQRHWTQTTALNDADEVAGTILMHSRKENA